MAEPSTQALRSRSIAGTPDVGRPIDRQTDASAGRPCPWYAAPLRQISKGQLVVEMPDGREMRFGNPGAGDSGRMRIRNTGLLGLQMLLDGEMGLHKAYMMGYWDSPDVVAVLSVLARNEEPLTAATGQSVWGRMLRRLQHRSRANTRAGSARNIAAHYDLGNEFFARWLDGSMSYSAGLYVGVAGEGSDLERLYASQLAKYRRLLDSLDASPGQHILEIGCGWGGFAIMAASRGMRVTGITISREQYDYAIERIDKAGLSDRIELRLMDYRDLPERYPDGFDHVVSIEMFEAVGEERWPLYFQTLNQVLRPGGRAALQVITIDESRFEAYRDEPDFIQTFVFPGGMLPSPERLSAAAAAGQLQVTELDHFGADYAETLRIWRQRFNAVRDDLPADKYDSRFKRLWDYYLAYCETGFALDRTSVVQVCLEHARPVDAGDAGAAPSVDK